MEAQQLRYCTSADGTRLAYTSFGAGPPLLVIQRWAVDIDVIWRHSEVTSFYERLTAFSSVVTFDRRGQGASDRDVADVSVERHVEDVLAVAEAAGLARFDLFGDGDAAAVAIEFAAGHPEMVSRLAISGAWSRAARSRLAGQAGDMRELTRNNWFVAANLFANVVFPSGPAELMHRAARAWARTMSGEMADRYAAVMWSLDVRDACRRVQAPALVMQRQGQHQNKPIAQRVASWLRAAEYVEIPGDIDVVVYDGDEAAAVMRRFLRGDAAPAPSQPATPQATAGTTIILFADIVDSTALTERMGDAAFRERARALDASLRAIIGEAGGAAVEGRLLGDGVLATFPSASQAIAAACRFAGAASGAELQLHVGLHAGDVIREEGNVFGGAVNIASRISALASPGEVLVSDIVRGLARTSADVTFDDRGEHALKGIADPVRVYAVMAG